MLFRSPFYLLGNWVFRLISAPSVTDRNMVLEVGMRKTLGRFVGAKKKIIFVIDNPEIDFDPRLCLDRPLRPFWKIQSPCAVPRSQFDLRNKDYRRVVFKVLQDYPEVVIFDAAAHLCDKDWCQVKIDGEVLYKDTDHLSLAGSRLIAKELAKVMKGHEPKALSR